MVLGTVDLTPFAFVTLGCVELARVDGNRGNRSCEATGDRRMATAVVTDAEHARADRQPVVAGRAKRLSIVVQERGERGHRLQSDWSNSPMPPPVERPVLARVLRNRASLALLTSFRPWPSFLPFHQSRGSNSRFDNAANMDMVS